MCGLVAGLGFFFVTQAYRLAEGFTVATFEYLALPLSVLWAYLFWREMPGPYSVLGMVLVVGSGLYVLRHESSRTRAVAE
jgi:drug/metabolite transporter (DMT)-like permease